MKRFEFLPKTADIKLRAFGRSFEEALENAAQAMTSLMVEGSVKGTTKREIEVVSDSREELAVKFLEELLFLRDSEGLLLSRIEGIRVKREKMRFKLNAVITFDSIRNYEYREVVKAVTFNELKLFRSGNKVVLQVVLDT
ncbi:MAG: archease [Candidatus Woesearchaeota archaeon]